jgi:hypothetical protein
MRQHRRTIIIAVLGAVVACGVVVAALFVFRARPVPVSPAAQPSGPVHRPLTSPFTGEPVTSLGPALAVKIDNIVNARPRTGLSQADIVYSGAQPQLLQVVERARIVDLYAGRVGGYSRDSRRVAPDNLYARTSPMHAQARGASTARDIGFRFGPGAGRRPGHRGPAGALPGAPFTFRWSPRKGRWLVWMDGAAAMTTDRGQLGAATVVVQHTRVGSPRFREWGGPAPMRTARVPGRRWCSAEGRPGRPTGRARTARTAPPSPPVPGSG